MLNKSKKWFTDKHLQWQSELGERKSITDFADYLEVNRGMLGHYFEGRSDPTYQNTLTICRKLRDYSLLDVLGYNQPKLYVFRPNGHGELTLSVMAYDENDAKQFIQEYIDKNKHLDCDVNGWGTDYYRLELYECGNVAINYND